MVFGKKKRRITRLLIVEDEPLVAFDAEHFLVEEGFIVVATTDSVADAIAHIAAEEKVDMVLIDLALADGSGIDVAHAARAGDIPALFVTGKPPEEVEGHALGCLSKPYRQRDLLAAIAAVEALLDGKSPRRLPSGLKLFQPVA